MRNTKPATPIWQAVCTSCRMVAGTGTTIAALAAFGRCTTCGQPTEPKREKTARPKRHHGGLTRKKYLDPETLLSFRKFMGDRAKERNSRRAWTDYVIVEILARTGLRAGELVRGEEHPNRYLRIEDVVLDERDPAINIVEGKGNVSRVVKISPSLRGLLAWYISEFRADAAPDAALIETEWGGTALSYSSLNGAKCKLWAREYEQKVGPLGLTSLSAHVFRHSMSLVFLEKTNNNYRALADILGHASPAITMSVYSHTTEKQSREFADRM